MRLLLCHDCKSLEEVPDFDGPVEQDTLLQILVDRHKYAPGYPHHGQLLQIKQEDWNNAQYRDAIVKEIRNGAGHTGLDPEAYAARNTFREDALKCYDRHSRPKDGCIDWKDLSKRLGNSILSDEEKKTARDHGLRSRGVVYLCDFCPVRANYVDPKKYDKAGLYD